jgi:hypothetical protein
MHPVKFHRRLPIRLIEERIAVDGAFGVTVLAFSMVVPLCVARAVLELVVGCLVHAPQAQAADRGAVGEPVAHLNSLDETPTSNAA